MDSNPPPKPSKTPEPRKGPRGFCVCLLIASAIVCAVVWHRGGILRTADSWRYLAAASGNWARLTHWPPLYPLALAVAGDLWTAILSLAALLAICWSAGGPVALMLVASSSTVASLYGLVLSEVLFLPLAALALLEADRGRADRCAVAISAACLTRYLGVLLVPVCALSLPRRRWWVLAMAVLPAASWMALHGDGARQVSRLSLWSAYADACAWAIPWGGLRTRVALGTLAWALLVALGRGSWARWIAVYPVAVICMASATYIGSPGDCGGRMLAAVVPAIAVTIGKLLRVRTSCGTIRLPERRGRKAKAPKATERRGDGRDHNPRRRGEGSGS